MAIEVFIVESAAPNVSAILTQAAKTTASKLEDRPKWILSAAEGIRFAGCGRYDSMRKLVLQTVIRDCDPAWEDFPDDGSECAVGRPWHTCFLRFDLPGDDYSSTACIASNAASRWCAVRGGEPGGGLVVFGGVRRPYRAAAGTFRREILAATRASNGSPARPQTGQDGKSHARASGRSREQGNSGS